jgi:GT2 family glycosyltransferase
MSQREASLAVRLHVVLACRNRRDLTVRAISTFAGAAALAGAEADFTVFDDGSTDGTAEALAALDLPVTRIAGDGSAFWARSMAEAEAHVLGVHQDGYAVWLNDDVELDGDAVEVALAAAALVPSAVLVGAMRAPDTGRLTYSGLRRRGFHPLHFEPVGPDGRLQAVETFNGNLVFVPIEIARKLGGLDGLFSHALADIDYGVRVRDAGCEIFLLPRVVGSCPRNPIRPRGRTMDDWHSFLGVKGGGNYRSMKRILRKWHSTTWLGYIGITYTVWWTRRLAHVARGQSARPLRNRMR